MRTNNGFEFVVLKFREATFVATPQLAFTFVSRADSVNDVCSFNMKYN